VPDPAWRVRARGLVQGVGFRPFVWRLAEEQGVRGWARNDAEGVLIHAEGDAEALADFVGRLRTEAPPGARVDAVEHHPAAAEGCAEFDIQASRPPAGPARARVPPDRAACAECVREVFDPRDRRHGHPFASCTGCGPRYSILTAMPYDRPRTTMAGFAMCPECAAEYASPESRRFHAQPIACPACGPRIEGEPLAEAARALEEGRIVALKGLGGFQLLVRADLSGPVSRLRRLKGRPSKPFAVMARSLVDAGRLALLDDAERALLSSPEAPIVLVRPRAGAPLADEAAPGLARVGLMLPTTPMHHLLLAGLPFPVVATSGNLSDEPIALDSGQLGAVSDVEVSHNRPIARRVDDSLAQVVAGAPRVLRLARGYAPLPLPALEGTSAPPTLAVGGHQKSAVALWTGAQAVLGPHVGDLETAAAREAFEEMTRALPALYGCRPEVAACDLHPDYASTRWAEASGLPLVRVQHHHAHAAACLAEHGLTGEALAFAWDGTGLGTDGTIWGGEVLLARLDAFERVGHLRPFVLPGGDAAVRQPARVALALLAQALGSAEVRRDPDVPRLLGLPEETVAALLRMIEAGVSCPATSSMGRLFDGVATIACGISEASYEGEPAARLEAWANEGEGAYDIPGDGDWREMARHLWRERRAGVAPGVLAGRFHEAVLGWAAAVAERHPGLPVVLGGGCFANARLLAGLLARLSHRPVFAPARIPPGDGGLAVGQLAVALARSR
jgi:hydrogenase maturation protein HypF